MPIAMSKDEWARLKRWTDGNREDPEVVRRREYVHYMNQMSQKMTKDWPNSLENVNKRNEELRRARLAAAEQANSLFYARYVKQKQAEQRRLMYNARDSFFKNKDAPKLLLGAVIETVIQKEREEQVKFNKQLKRQAAEKKKQDDDQIIQNAKEWHALMELRRKRRFEVNKKHQKEILDQAHEVAERKRKEYETELNMQKIDNIKAQEQMDTLREFEEEYSKKEKEHILADMQRAKQEADARRREQAARDRMDDRLIDVLQRSRARVERRRRHTEIQIQKEKQEVLDKISQRLESGDAERDAKEQQILEKAIKEKEAATEARRQAELRKKEQFKQDRIETRKQFLKKEEERLHEANVMHQWEIMNRFKNDELYADFQERLREERRRKIREYREDIIKQWREREEREAAERAETRRFYGALAEQKLRDADNKLLTHGAALLQEARQHGRPDHALRQALDRYCKLYRLYPMPELPASMQEHFARYAPRDLARPDPAYRYPQPPGEPREGERDGLQEPGVRDYAPRDLARPDPAYRYPQPPGEPREGERDGLQEPGVRDYAPRDLARPDPAYRYPQPPGEPREGERDGLQEPGVRDYAPRDLARPDPAYRYPQPPGEPREGERDGLQEPGVRDYAPRDLARPDPAYRYPQPPGEPREGERDGLQEPGVRDYAPRDLARPDPAYRYPQPPGEPREGERDGLQEPGPGPSKPPAASNKEPEDYKRVGPANGLQRKNAQEKQRVQGGTRTKSRASASALINLQHDIVLPPIAVRPCETPQCRCELRPSE